MVVTRTELSQIVDQVNKKFDELEAMMNEQMHLTDPKTVEEKMYSIN